MTYDVSLTEPVYALEHAREEMTGLLDEFVKDTTGVTLAVLASRDGIKQVFPSHMTSKDEIDWLDELAASSAGLMALAKGTTGPTGHKLPVGQLLIERTDSLFLLTEAGIGHSFTDSGKTVATVLLVLVATDANIGQVAYDAGVMVQRFAPFMTTPVRVLSQDDGVA
ncbi:roadblock/LC7 domain-containing protein [Streptomyces sp. NPDC001401]|uniref:roadblock/LC7 domain-containing protein n=1 Tax=Streptomyces sp. NPDC001401 TaxID=3364570 RepID=UPI00367A6F1E